MGMKSYAVAVALLTGISFFSAALEANDQGIDFPAVARTAAGVQDYAISVRRAIHKSPELRWKEDKTLAFIEQEIQELIKANKSGAKVDIQKQFTGGLVVDVAGEVSAKKLFRADVDALPLKEATSVPFASMSPGVMHACGHDAHAAMLLGALKALLEGTSKPRRSLRFVFQRAEENPADESGGARLVREGVLEGVEEVYGLHVSQSSPPGVLLSREGPILANSDRFRVKVMCSGGHVANPEKGSNAIDIVTDMHVALRGLDRLVLGALEPCTLVPTVSNAGSAPNTRPAEAEVWYAVRQYLAPEKRDSFAAALEQRIRKVVAAYPDAKVEYEYIKGHPAVINNSAIVREAENLFRSAGLRLEKHRQDFAGDDLGHYLQKRPGAYWALGVQKDGGGSLHSPTFDMDESAMKTGVLFWLLLALR